MKFIREIPLDKVIQSQIDQLHQFGFTLVYKEDSIEVWAQVKDSDILNEVKVA